MATGQVRVETGRRHRFPTRYTRTDIELLAQVDEAAEQKYESDLNMRPFVNHELFWKGRDWVRSHWTCGQLTELLGRDELDEKRLVGLQGVVKVSHTTIHGRAYLNLDAFAPAGEWDEFMAMAPVSEPTGTEPEVA